MPKFIAVGTKSQAKVDSWWNDSFIEEFEGSKEDFINFLKEKIIQEGVNQINCEIEWIGEIKEAYPELLGFKIKYDRQVSLEISKRRTIMLYEKARLKQLYFSFNKNDCEREEYKILFEKYGGSYN